MKYTYEEMFQRNIGVFTPEEQEKIKALKVAIAGCGGMGGSIAYSLARLGVGQLNIADPEVFEISNVNRQFGSYIDTVGQNKAFAIANELKRINPGIIINVWPVAIDRNNVIDFIDGCDAVMDGIEFFDTSNELELHREAVKKGLWVFMLQGVNNITSFLTFNPNGVTFEDMFTKNGEIQIDYMIAKMFPELPNGSTPDLIKDIINKYKNGDSIHFSSYSVLAPMAGVFIAEEFIKVIIKGKEPSEIAPSLFSLDLDKMLITHFDKDSKEIKK